ncbi:MAG: MipA/OmpV family protein [Pseudomonadota bacterium]
MRITGISRARLAVAGLLVAGLMVAKPAVAADEILVTDLGGTDVIIELGLRGAAKPAFEGSDEILFAVAPLVKLEYLDLPGLITIGGGPKRAFSFRPSFNIIGEREGDDIARGLSDVDTAVEVGFGASYRVGAFRAVGEVRRGFGGHDGVVGEAGVDVVLEPNSEFSVSFGPRASFASDSYADTYFTVAPDDAAASGLPVFDADGGLKGLGVAAEARYAVNEDWTVYADASWTRLVEDAADSPITQNEDQFEVGIGLTRKFRFDLFD